MRFARSSGILLHPTSLPGAFGSGDLGASCYHFIDWLVTAGQSVWQMLPVGPIGITNSPYLSLSAFAGNPLLLDLQELVNHGWLEKKELSNSYDFPDLRVDYSKVKSVRMAILEKSAKNFFKSGDPEDHKQFETFCEIEKSWLNDYALFQVLDNKFKGTAWTSWDQNLSRRNKSALLNISEELSEQMRFHMFTQWCFVCQWRSLKKYANDRGIKLVGDIPIFVAHHSTDVWVQPKAYHLDKNGFPTVVAGVPPDYFSSTGQRWGNPIYRWKKMKTDNYNWWSERFRRTFELFDIMRIDHFRGFESYWEIQAEEKNAIKGRWVKGPDIDFFKKVQNKLGGLPIIAEDLGIITPKVHALREKLDFPGMKVLQFAFSGGPENNYLPHNYKQNCVVYTGTHDNDTTQGWYEKASNHERDFVRRYCITDGKNIHCDLIKLALQSAADIAIIPFQDVIGLGSEGRMNFPGTSKGNWEWRFTWDQVGPEPAKWLYDLSALFGRCNPEGLNLV
jgi:4-alpha-glucanotransferase